MPKAATPFKVDLAKIKANHLLGKFPFKIPCSSCQKPCGNTSLEIFNTRITTYGSIDKLYQNYVCTSCRKIKKIVPIREVTKGPETNEAGVVITKDAFGWMPDGRLDYWWMHPLFNLPSDQREMILTGDGYCTFVPTIKKVAA